MARPPTRERSWGGMGAERTASHRAPWLGLHLSLGAPCRTGAMSWLRRLLGRRPEAPALWPPALFPPKPQGQGTRGQPQLSSGLYQVVCVGLALLRAVQRTARLSPALFSRARRGPCPGVPAPLHADLRPVSQGRRLGPESSVLSCRME